MSISDVASLIGGAALGAPVSEMFKLVIEEAKKVKDFKPLSQDLASTMERLVPLFKDIELMQDGSNPGKDELKLLIEAIQRAEEMIRKCSRVRWYDIPKRALYTKAIKEINQNLLRFCQIDFQMIHHRNMLQFMRSMASVSTKIDLLSNTENELAELFEVPQPETVTIFWLDQPLRELKKLLFEDRVVNVVVSAPSACGKTMLVTKLCHDADIKGKFKQIFFVTLSIAPNARLIVQRLLQRTGCKANEFANNLDAGHSIQQLLKQLGQSGSTLLVLDDVWPEEESLLDKLLIQLPDYKILVTSRFEFPRFGPTYHLEPLIDEDLKNLFIECTPQPNCQSCAKRYHLLQKILKRCNGSPFAMNPPSSICDGSNSVIEHERPVNVLGVLWHPECFCCDACDKPIAVDEVENHVSNSRGKFHKYCYERYCYLCKEKQMKTYNKHPFWEERYCPAHEADGTPKCCSCERLEPRSNYVMLADGRWLCLECMNTAGMDSDECQPLHFDMREFFEGLNMKIEKKFPFLLVEKQALNKAEKEEKIVSQRPLMGPNNELIGLATEPQRVVRQCEVTAILIQYGLPRLLTGYILAHEMMRAYLRLIGYRNLNKVLEEGICQMLGHMWLESQTYATADDTRKGEWSDFEKKLVEFCMNQIETENHQSMVSGSGKLKRW